LQEDGDRKAAQSFANGGYLELGAAREGNEGERQGVRGRQSSDGLLVEEPERVRARDKAGDQVSGEMGQAERLDELPDEGAGDQQKSDGGDTPKTRLGIRRGSVDDEDEDAKEGKGEHAHPRGALWLDRGAHVGAGSIDAIASAWWAAFSVRRNAIGAARSPKAA
jgi:hypothetical protein